MMMKKFDDFVESICKYNKFPDEQTEEIKYIMRIISLELIKLLVVIILFSIFGYTKEILLVVVSQGVGKKIRLEMYEPQSGPQNEP